MASRERERKRERELTLTNRFTLYKFHDNRSKQTKVIINNLNTSGLITLEGHKGVLVYGA
jgi:hypothetical protein